MEKLLTIDKCFVDCVTKELWIEAKIIRLDVEDDPLKWWST